MNYLEFRTQTKLKIEEEDLIDSTGLIYELADEYIRFNVLEMHESHFHTTMVDDITDLLYSDWIEAGICQEEQKDIIHEYCEMICRDYFSLQIACVPVRSLPLSIVSKNRPISRYQTKLTELLNTPQHEQRSTEWYEFRHQLLSASSIGKLFGTEASQNRIIFEKCQSIDSKRFQKPNVSSSLHWGQKYEPISSMFYEHLYQTKITEFGCIKHKDFPFLGASPDGIVMKQDCSRYGRMIEIKNVVSRQLTGIPLKDYWIQMQIQMECCDLDECDFLETQFKEFETEEDFWKCEPKVHKGVCLYFVERVSIGQSSSNNSQAPRSNTYPKIEQEEGFSLAQEYSGVPYYEYMPFNIPLTKENVDKWIEDTRARLRRSWSLYTTIYWHLEEYSCILVNRNRLWFEHAIPHIEDTWKTIEKERETGCEHRAPAKKVVKNPLLEVVQKEDGQKELKNFPFQKGVCLVKL